MNIITYSKARNYLESVLDMVDEVADVTIIGRHGVADALVRSLAHHQSIVHTTHCLLTPANAAHSAKSIGQHKSTKVIRRELAQS